jgi:hypothetical protein
VARPCLGFVIRREVLLDSLASLVGDADRELKTRPRKSRQPVIVARHDHLPQYRTRRAELLDRRGEAVKVRLCARCHQRSSRRWVSRSALDRRYQLPSW